MKKKTSLMARAEKAAERVKSWSPAKQDYASRVVGGSREKPKPIKSVPDRLTALGDIYRARNKIYGDNFLHGGKILKGLFPYGIALNTEREFNRFFLLVHSVSKMSRYAQCVARGEEHHDSLDDLSVYSMIQQIADELTRGDK